MEKQDIVHDITQLAVLHSKLRYIEDKFKNTEFKLWEKQDSFDPLNRQGIMQAMLLLYGELGKLQFKEEYEREYGSRQEATTEESHQESQVQESVSD